VSARTMSMSSGVENEKSDMVTCGRVACPLVCVVKQREETEEEEGGMVLLAVDVPMRSTCLVGRCLVYSLHARKLDCTAPLGAGL
jgi:hypothetical protein